MLGPSTVTDNDQHNKQPLHSTTRRVTAPAPRASRAPRGTSARAQGPSSSNPKETACLAGREDATPASTVLDGASPAKIVAKRPGLCAKAVARKRARAGKKAAKKGADSDTSPDDNEDDVDASYDGNHDDGSEDEQVNAPARRAARALFDDDDGNSVSFLV